MSAGSVNRLIQFNITEASGVTRGFFFHHKSPGSRHQALFY
jgi:hypothetical protein